MFQSVSSASLLKHQRIVMMFTTVTFRLVGFLITSVMIRSCMCQTNDFNCSMYLDEVREVLASKIPPIKDSRMTDNYYNISRALFPSIDLPALYVRVTLQFLKDYKNGTMMIDDILKLTWSKACTYVSVKHISLFAMTVFSLGTLFPQRRETELTFTVLPFCKDSPYARDLKTKTKTWRYVVSTLEDNIVSPKISDPRINTVACVIEGHEGDSDQPIKYPEESRPLIVWDFCWLVLAASFVTSAVIWFYLKGWLKDAMEKKKEAKPRRILAGTVLKMTIVTFVITALVFSVSFIFHVAHYGISDVIPYVITYVIITCVLVFILTFPLRHYRCKTNCKFRCYKVGFSLFFPALFITIHHFLWVLCGIISEPYWATPIFLMECLFGFSIMYSLYLYEKDVIVPIPKRITQGQCWIKLYLFFSVVGFSLVLLVVGFVGHGHIVNVTTAGVIEVIITIAFMWLVKTSGLHLERLKENKKNGDGEGAGGDRVRGVNEERIALNPL